MQLFWCVYQHRVDLRLGDAGLAKRRQHVAADVEVVPLEPAPACASTADRRRDKPNSTCRRTCAANPFKLAAQTRARRAASDSRQLLLRLAELTLRDLRKNASKPRWRWGESNPLGVFLLWLVRNRPCWSGVFCDPPLVTFRGC